MKITAKLLAALVAVLMAVTPIATVVSTTEVTAEAATFSNSGVTLNINNGQALVTYNGSTTEATRALVCRDGAVSGDGVVWLHWMSNNLYYYIPGVSTSCTLYKANVSSISDTGYTIGTTTTPYPSKAELTGNSNSNNSGNNNSGNNNSGNNNSGNNNSGNNNSGNNNSGNNNSGNSNSGNNNGNNNGNKSRVSFSGKTITVVIDGKTYTGTADGIVVNAGLDASNTIWAHTVDGSLYYWNYTIEPNSIVLHKYASDCATLVFNNGVVTGYYDTKGVLHNVPTLAEIKAGLNNNSNTTTTTTKPITVNGSTLTIVYNGTTYTTTISGTPVQYGWDQSGILWVFCNDGKLYAWNPKTNPNAVVWDLQATGVTMLLFNNSNPYAYVTSSGKFVLLVYKAPTPSTATTKKYDKYNYVVTYNTRRKLFDSNGEQKAYFDLNSKGRLKYKEITRFSKNVKKAGFNNKGNIIVLLKNGNVYKLSKSDGGKVLIATGIKRLHFTNKGLVHYLVRNSGSYSNVYNR